MKLKNGAEYVNTLKAREYKVHGTDIMKACNIPLESIVNIYYAGGYVHIVTEETVVEKFG